jgi:hypothetical protein
MNMIPTAASVCQLTVEPFKQCCCKCAYHLPVHFHCTTEPKPEKLPEGPEGSCACGVQKGWACVSPESGRVYDNWPEHSCGCEVYTTQEDLEKQKKSTEVWVIVRRPPSRMGTMSAYWTMPSNPAVFPSFPSEAAAITYIMVCGIVGFRPQKLELVR